MMDRITDILRIELVTLAAALQARGVPLIVGGGYGLLLRQEFVEKSGVRTVRESPVARSTTDLDLFLSVEVITDAVKMGALRDVLHGCGYSPVAGAEHYQFRKSLTYRGAQRTVKVDLLAPPPRDSSLRALVKMDERRIRPRETRGIHAHNTPEAFSITEMPLLLELGSSPTVQVRLPHPYSFLLLKLFAYRDRRHDPAKELGVYHAFDLYRIIAMMDEDDYSAAEVLRDGLAGDEVVVEARRIVRELFAGADSPGALAILEHARSVGVAIPNLDLLGFLEDLRTFFPEPV